MSHKYAIDHNLKAFNSQVVNEYDSRPLTQKLSKIIPQILLDYPHLQSNYDHIDSVSPPSSSQSLFTKDKQLLDFACGTGIVGEQLYPYVGLLTGVDINQHVLEIFNNRLTNKYDNVTSHLMDILDPTDPLELNKLYKSTDIITCTISYHHLGDYESTTIKLGEFLKENGVLFIVDFYNPNVEYLGDGRISENEAVTHMGGLKKQSLIDTLTKAGLINVEVTIILGIHSWYHTLFIYNHCTVQTIEKVKNNEYPSKMIGDEIHYLIEVELVIAKGEKPRGEA